jgi:hypothetical protein
MQSTDLPHSHMQQMHFLLCMFKYRQIQLFVFYKCIYATDHFLPLSLSAMHMMTFKGNDNYNLYYT